MNTATTGKPRLLQGNGEAVVEGALAARVPVFCRLPHHPGHGDQRGHVLPAAAVGGTFIQMEDEIASLGAVIGASLAGVKAMTATSGPGFSLMQENLGFACMAEVPCVIVNVMRGGPSTGLPTRVSQGDVMQARWGTHGDHPIIVLAAATTRDCFDLTVTAFNLSEKYRTPVILLTDEVVAHTREKWCCRSLKPWSGGPPAPHGAAGMVRPLRRYRQRGAAHGDLRRRLPLPRHRPHPRRPRLSHRTPR